MQDGKKSVTLVYVLIVEIESISQSGKLDGSLNCRIKKSQGSLDDSTVIDVSTTEVQKVPRMRLRGWNVFQRGHLYG